MKLNKQLSFTAILFLLISGNIFSQRGKDGAGNFTTGTTIVNTVDDTLALSAAAGSSSITLGNSSGFAAGDLVMIIQMMGAKLNSFKDTTAPWFDTNNSIPSTTAYGSIMNYYNAGNYEFAEINSVSGNTLNLDCSLKNSYTAFSADATGKKFSNVQVVRVPRYTTLNVSGTASLTCSPWNGKTGGILVVEVKYTTTLNVASALNVSGNGFRGGAVPLNSNTYGSTNYGSAKYTEGGTKGEGIGGDTARYRALFSGVYGRGAVANGGGGGDAHNSGGGGGGNGGNIATYDGLGNPAAGYTNAWNQESAGFATHTSSGGGRGGYTYSKLNANPATTPPGSSSWGGTGTADFRRNFGGLGGRPLDYSTGRLFIGGGGGSGHQNESFGGAGGNGGGMVYILAYGNVSGTGTITADGTNGGATVNLLSGNCDGRDGAGGGGAGGTVVINTMGTINLTAATAISAKGGTGGNQQFYNGCTSTEAYGPGGGGGGGYIATSGTIPANNISGGNNGIVAGNTGNIKNNFPPNGATIGGAGSTGAVSTFSVSAGPQTICAGNTATLTASTSGTVPGGLTINWYSAAAGGSPIFTGTTFTTPVLSSTTVYYVGSCPGTYRDSVVVTVNSGLATPAPTATSASVCAGQTINLNANVNGVTYTWSGPNSFTSSSQNPSIPNATTAATGTYSLVVSSGSCSSAAGTVNVTVNAIPATPAPTTTTAAICAGQQIDLFANVAGVTYNWTGPNSFSSSNQNPSIPNATTAANGTYSLTVTNAGCTSSAGTVDVAVNPIPATPAPTAASAAICAGQQIDLFANVTGVTYNWTGPNTFSSNSQNPSVPGATTAASGTYSLTVTSAGCTSTAGTVNVTVNPIPATPAPTVTSDTVCAGQQIDLFANVAGVTYNWTGPNSYSSSVQDPSIAGATTSASGTYSLTITSAGCTSGAGTVDVTVNAIPATPAPTSNSPVCTGQNINLFANVNGVTYNWTGPNSFSSSLQNPVISNAGAAESGTYTLTITNAGCTSPAGTVTVGTTTTANPTITSVSPLCQNDSPITLSAATGGGTWSGNGITDANLGTFDPSAAVAGTDTITYTLTGTCGGTDTVVITVTPNADASITNAPASLCATGSPYSLTTAQAGGTWSGTGVDASGNFDPAVAGLGTWQVIYTIGGACGNADTVDIVVNSTADATITAVPPMCQNAGTTTLTAAQGGGTWSGPGITNATTGTFDPSIAVGNDSIIYTITGSCGAADTLVISVTANADASITNAPASMCISDSPIALSTAQPAGTWNGTGVNASGTFNPATAGQGTWQIIYTIAGACGDADTVNITVNSSSDPTITAVSPLCQNAAPITLSAAQAGGTWSGNGITDANLGTFDPSAAVAGTDTITYTIPGACGASDTVVITVNPMADATITNPPATLCAGNPATTLTSAQGGGTWTGTGITNGSNGTFDPTVSGTGTFQVIYTISGACGDADTISVTIAPLVASTINAAGPFCSNNPSVTLTAANTGGTWSGTGITNTASGTFDPATAGAGSQTITYTIGGTCGTSSTTTITVNASADATISSAPSALCSNAGTVTLTTAQPGGTWTGTGVNASGVFDPATAGNGPHQVIYTISGTCGDADTVTITVNSASGLSFTHSSVICKNTAALFGSNSSNSCATLTWDFGDGDTGSGSNPTHIYDSSGVFDVIAVCITTQGCIDSVKVTHAVTVNPLPDPYFTIDNHTVGVGEPVNYTALSPGGNSLHWNFGEPLSGAADSATGNPVSHAYSELGTYCTTMQLFSLTTGCYSYSVGCIDVVADGSVTIPNIFTPNGDNSNDLFNIKSASVKSLTCTIFDRWGLKMYDWDGINGSWDGKAKSGSKAPDGIYYYIVKYTDTKGDSKEINGFVTLVN